MVRRSADFEFTGSWVGSGDTNCPDTASAVSLHDVRVNFGGVSALSGITIDVLCHELVAVVGTNGAGKSTLLNAVCGLLPQRTHGTISVLGQDVREMRADRLARLGVGRSFQDPRLVDSATVLENLLCGAHNSFGHRALDQVIRYRRACGEEQGMTARAVSVLEFVGLRGIAERIVSELPYGTRKLIDVARSMISLPRLMLLDEPSSGLDQVERAAIIDVLTAIRDRGRTTVVVVEHHPDVVRATATRVVGLHAGTIVATGTADEVLNSTAFRTAGDATEAR